MKLLFGIDTWGLVGGTERYAAAVVPALRERGFELDVLCREAVDREFLQSADWSPTLLEESALGSKGLNKAQKRQLDERVRALAPDVIFLQALRNLDALEVLEGIAPVVRFVHDHTLFCPGLNKVHESGELCSQPMGFACLEHYYLKQGCICFKQVQHKNRVLEPMKVLRDRMREIEVNARLARLLTNSNYMRAELLQVGFHPDQVVRTPMFTDSGSELRPKGDLPAATEAFLRASNEHLIFTPARLTLPDKGVDYFLSALAQVRAPFRCVIAGTGPAEEWLRQKAVDEGLGERVHFAGWLNEGAIESLYARARMVVCPSVWNEPFGLVGIEAMAHQKPVVAFDVGGIPEWLRHQETGLLVTRCDAHGMSLCMERLLQDDALAQELGQGGQRYAQENFSKRDHMDVVERELLAAIGA